MKNASRFGQQIVTSIDRLLHSFGHREHKVSLGNPPCDSLPIKFLMVDECLQQSAMSPLLFLDEEIPGAGGGRSAGTEHLDLPASLASALGLVAYRPQKCCVRLVSP